MPRDARARPALSARACVRQSAAKPPMDPCINRSILFLALATASLTACAQSPAPGTDEEAPQAPATTEAADGEPAYAVGSAEANVREAIRAIAPQLRVDRIDAAPVPGFRQAIVGGQVVYVTDDGRYLLQGTLLDVAGRKDMNEVAMSALRRDLLATVPASERIVFAPEDPLYTVSVFTDVDCGYCRTLHGEMAGYHAQGIAIEYLAFPRMGPGSENFEEMVAVWCADDRQAAITEAKQGGNVTGSGCTSPVAMQYALGQRLGLTGTPMIVAADGSQLGGYVPPARLRELLDKQVAEAGGAAPDAPAADAAGSP